MTNQKAKSIRQRLLNRSRDSGENFQRLLLHYGIERLLFRLSKSKYADEFILKGASLFYARTGEFHRPTKDIDMLRLGDTSQAVLKDIILACIRAPFDDGLSFDEKTLKTSDIREGQPYEGVRVVLKAFLGKSEISLQLDVATGDEVIPADEMVQYPSLLDDMPKASLRAYRLETAISEKCEAMIKLGMFNTRMKDFYDIYILARDHEVEFNLLRDAVCATFKRRGTAIPSETPVSWTETFSEDPGKRGQWQAFLRKSNLEAPDLTDVIGLIKAFLLPVFQSSLGRTSIMEWKDKSWNR